VVDLARQKGLEFRFEPSLAMHNYLIGDSKRLSQILLNFLSNAIKFTEAGSVGVDVVFRPVAGNRVELEFAVVDTGIGIRPEKLDHIFDEFRQADESTTRLFGGTGLGLTISRHLAQLMGGEIGVSSEMGVGSRFWCRLELPVGDEIVAEQMATTEPAPSFGGVTVLLAEDDEINSLVAKELLEHIGLSVVAVRNGVEVLNYFDQGHRADVVLMDVNMPVMDGMEATRRLRERSELETLPIIALTANALADERGRCLGVGMSDFLTKPIDMDLLSGVLEKWVIGNGERLRSTIVVDQSYTSEADDCLLDVAEGLMRSMGDLGLYSKLLSHFVDGAAALRAELEQSLGDRDIPSIEAAVHRLKGSSSQIAAGKLSAAASRIERDIARMSESGDFDALYHLWDLTLTEARQWIKQSALPESNAEQIAKRDDDAGDLAHLKRLLNDGDSAAVDYIEQVHQVIARIDADALVSIRNSIACFDFVAAADALDSVLTLLEAPES